MRFTPFPLIRNLSVKPGLGIFLPLLILFAGYCLLSSLPDLRPAVPEMLGLTAALTLCLAVMVFMGEKNAVGCPPGVILVVALVVRILFLFHSPQLSDDIYRYLFDGFQLLSGQNPYAGSPEMLSQTSSAAAALAAKVNHPHLTTLYPPGAQLIFATGVFLGGITGLKLLLIGMDMVLIALMLRILSALQVPLWRGILYAWHPLPVLEIASSGHIDGAGLAMLFAAICLLLPLKTAPQSNALPVRFKNRPVSDGPPAAIQSLLSGLLFAFAVMIKLFPIVYLPLMLYPVRGRQRRFFIAGLAAGALLLVLSFCPDIFNSLTTLHIYASTWEFSGLFFRTLRRWGLPGVSARAFLSAAFAVFLIYCYLRPKRSTTDACEPGASASPKPLMEDVLSSGFFIGFGFLLMTPTLHPWYGLYMVVFLPFFPNAAGLILSWSITLGYQVLMPYFFLNQWEEDPLAPFLIWVGPAMAIVLSLIARRFSAVRTQRRLTA